MSKEAFVTSGEVVFSNVVTEDVFNGQPTGYNLTLALDGSEAQKLSDRDVKVKTYQKDEESEAVLQRKFKSKFPVTVVDTEDRPFQGEIPYGSKVKVLWATGPAYSTHGCPAYLNRVRVVEVAEHDATSMEEF